MASHDHYYVPPQSKWPIIALAAGGDDDVGLAAGTGHIIAHL